MPDFKLKIAGHVAAVRSLFDSTPLFFHAYLTQEVPEFSVAVTPEDITFERDMSLQEAKEEGFRPRNFPDTYLERLAIQRKVAEALFHWDILLLHGSAVAVDGACYIFIAKSGTGKSTHTRLWRQAFGDRAVMVNDDKPFLRIDREQVLVCGSPWSGKHGLDTNTEVPLKGICLLERGTENRICRDGDAISCFLLQQCYRPLSTAQHPKYLELVGSLGQKTPLWRMQCNREPDAALTSYRAMSKIEHFI